MSREWEGLLLVDKPSGPTSHDLVTQVRRLTGQSRVGHAGTLDPLASGLLPLVLGQATRLVRFLPHSPKRYTGMFRLGLRTDTDDVTGRVLEPYTGPLPDAGAVAAAAAGLRGDQMQVPPRVSARKVAGQRLYRLARRGIEVEARPAAVSVLDFDVTPTDRPELYGFAVTVSGGTYVRALVRDLGDNLGCGGALEELRRNRIGPLSVDQACTVSGRSLAPERVIPPEAMPLELPVLRLDDPAEQRRFVCGGSVQRVRSDLEDGLCRVTCGRGLLLGVAEKRGPVIQPRVVLGRPAP